MITRDGGPREAFLELGVTHGFAIEHLILAGGVQMQLRQPSNFRLEIAQV